MGSAFAASDTLAVAHEFVAELGDRTELDGGEGRHLTRVRRLRAGERVTLADGAGAWRPYVVSAVSAARLQFEAVGDVRREPEPSPGVGVAPALSKRGVEDVAVAVTELGATRLVPVVTARTVVRWDEEKRRRAHERLTRLVREASAQCRRSRLLVVEPVTSIESVATRGGLVVADRDGRSVRELGDSPAPGEWLVVSGPEGGFDHGEHELLGAVPRLALGPHVLRAGTAPIAAVAALNSRRSSGDP